jgi:hypothetical protein
MARTRSLEKQSFFMNYRLFFILELILKIVKESDRFVTSFVKSNFLISSVYLKGVYPSKHFLFTILEF